MILNKPTKRLLIILIVLLLAVSAVVGSASASEERITNGDFTASMQLTGWDTYVGDSDRDSVGRSLVESRACAFMQIYGGDGTGTAQISQTVDLRGVPTLSFRYFSYQGFTPDRASSYIGCIQINGNSIQDFNTGWNYSSWSPITTITIPEQYRVNNATLTFKLNLGSTNSGDKGRYYIMGFTDISAISSISQPSVSSWTYTDTYSNTVGIGNYGLNINYGSDGSTFAYITLNSFDTGGVDSSQCYIIFDRNGDGIGDSQSGLGYDWYPAYFYSSGVYNPQFCFSNGYYNSPWYELGETVVARLKINTAEAVLDPSDRFVSIGISDKDIPTTWLYSNPTYYWNFDNPNGTSAYQRNTTDSVISYEYPSTAQKKVYNIGMYAVLKNSSDQTVIIGTIPFNNAIDLRDNSISFTNTTYSSGDTMTVNWDISKWRATYPSNTYNLNLYLQDSGGSIDISNPDYSTTITGNSGSTNITAPSVAGYYLALIRDVTRGENVISTTTSASVVGYNNLTVQILADSAIYTEATTLSLYVGNSTNESDLYTRTGFTNPVTDITDGTYTFSQLPYGGASSTYTLKAETVGYSTITVTFSLPVQDNILKMDFVKGASEGGYTGGSGTAYASTFVTIRVIDTGTGMYQSGVQMTIQAKQATNPAEWFVNLFGSAWGSTIAGTVQTGITDSQGGATFAVFPNYRYQVDLSFNDRTWQYTFQPSTLVTEEVIRIDITEPLIGSDKTDIINVDISSTKDDNKGLITVHYLDKTAKTTMLSIVVYEYIDGESTLATLEGTTNPLIITESSYGGKIDEYTQVLTINRASGKSYIVSVEALSETFGLDVTKDVIKRSQAVEFNGVRIPIGNIPDGLYIVICFVILVMLGAVGTQFNSRFYAIVVAIVGIFMLWAGWMSTLGIIGEGACVVAFVLAILYYIATGNHPQ